MKSNFLNASALHPINMNIRNNWNQKLTNSRIQNQRWADKINSNKVSLGQSRFHMNKQSQKSLAQQQHQNIVQQPQYFLRAAQNKKRFNNNPPAKRTSQSQDQRDGFSFQNFRNVNVRNSRYENRTSISKRQKKIQKTNAQTLDSIEQDIFRLKKALHQTISKYDVDKKEKKRTFLFSRNKENKSTKQARKKQKSSKGKKVTKVVKIDFDKSTQKQDNSREKKFSQSLSYLDSQMFKARKQNSQRVSHRQIQSNHSSIMNRYKKQKTQQQQQQTEIKYEKRKQQTTDKQARKKKFQTTQGKKATNQNIKNTTTQKQKSNTKLRDSIFDFKNNIKTLMINEPVVKKFNHKQSQPSLNIEKKRQSQFRVSLQSGERNNGQPMFGGQGRNRHCSLMRNRLDHPLQQSVIISPQQHRNMSLSRVFQTKQFHFQPNLQNLQLQESNLIRQSMIQSTIFRGDQIQSRMSMSPARENYNRNKIMMAKTIYLKPERKRFQINQRPKNIRQKISPQTAKNAVSKNQRLFFRSKQIEMSERVDLKSSKNNNSVQQRVQGQGMQGAQVKHKEERKKTTQIRQSRFVNNIKHARAQSKDRDTSNFDQYCTQVKQTSQTKNSLPSFIVQPSQQNANSSKKYRRQSILAYKQSKFPTDYYNSKLFRFCVKMEEPNNKLQQEVQKHIAQTYQTLTYFKTAQDIEPLVLEKMRITLPPIDRKKYKKTFVFDLDETLIHCDSDPTNPCDFLVEMTFPNGNKAQAGINMRPGAIELLQILKSKAEIIVFTASHLCYASAILDQIDPHNTLIDHRFCRRHCVPNRQKVFVKDLRIFNRDLKNIILVDNAAHAFGYQIDNGIPIIPYYEGKTDDEMFYLLEYLQLLLTVDDVREVNRKQFRLKQLQQSKGVLEYLNYMFQ